MIDSQQAFYLSREEIFEELNKSKKFKGNVEEIKDSGHYKQRQVGDLVWIKHPTYDEERTDNKEKPFYLVQISEDNDDKVYCKLAYNETSQDPQFPQERQEYKKKSTKNFKILEYSDLAEQGIKDMTELDELNHATVLRNIYTRYLKDQMYTFVGETLIAVNPFKPINNKVPKDYYPIIEAKLDYYEKFKSLDPHTYSIAAYALQKLMISETRQAIVISGESGSGKTESAKLCMRFLTSFGQVQGQETIGDKILKINPILEAFGNSKTVRNNNSSRFCVYVKMYFDKTNKNVLGARIQNYLLEKSRVNGCLTDQERNFHVFFYILRGVDDERAQQLGFVKINKQGVKERKNYQDFKCLKLCADLGEENDLKEYKILKNALENLFNAQEINAIERICAACIHIGELEIDDNSFNENENKPVTIKQTEILQLVAELLEIQNSVCLIEEIVHQGKKKDVQERTPDKPCVVQSTLGSLSKALYDNLFNWLVARMNEQILPKDTNNKMTIGLLDIFGFENFQINQFEQLCINFINEKMHNLYIQSVFEAEKKEMEREQLSPENLIFPPMKVKKVLLIMSNQQPPLGIFDIVEDKTGRVFGLQTMEKRIQECHDLILKTNQINLKRRTINKTIDEDEEDDEKNPIIYVKSEDFFETKFTINHSAKPITYDSKYFIERNADQMSASLNDLLNDETGQSIRDIYTRRKIKDEIQQQNGKQASKSIWGKFRIQIESLMKELAEPLLSKDLLKDKTEKLKFNTNKKSVQEADLCENTDLHFIRCLKPRDQKELTQEELIKGEQFVHAMILQQITYMGVLEQIRVKQANYQYRFKFADFY